MRPCRASVSSTMRDTSSSEDTSAWMPALGRVQVGDDDGRARRLEAAGDRGADPLRAARDDRDLAAERLHQRRGEYDVGTMIRFRWVWISGRIFGRKAFQRSSAASRARLSSRSAKSSYAHMCV